MAKHPNNRPKPVKREDPMTGAMKFFLAGCVGELYLLIVRRFYANGSLEQVVAWDTYLNYFTILGAVILAAGVVLSFLWKAECKKRVLAWCLTGAGAFLAGVSALVHYNMSYLTLLVVAVPVAMVIGIIWKLYDRECALSLTVLGVSMLVVWAGRRTAYATSTKLIVVLCLAVLVALLVLLLKAAKAGGKLGKYQLLPAKSNPQSVYVSCGLSILAVATVLVNVTVAYYAMWLLAAVLFALAVFYTVKQL